MIEDKGEQITYPYSLNLHKLTWAQLMVGAGSTLLDVGCGDGKVWKDTPIKPTTVDHIVADGAEPCHPDIVADAANIPVADNSYDVVSILEILEHVESPQAVLKEAIRIARLKVIATVPYEYKWDISFKPFTHPQHIRNYDETSWFRELKQTGYPFQIYELANGMVWLAAEIYVCKRI